VRFAVPMAVLMSLWAASASGQLYRWVDPETGSVKFSSYPPPWYNDAAKQRRAPRVERIPAGKAPAQKLEEGDEMQRPATPAQAGKVPEELESRRKSMLQQAPAIAAQAGADRGQALVKHLEAFAALSEEIDKLDPQGAAARRLEAQALFEKIARGGPR
jgi:hypothetical protein